MTSHRLIEIPTPSRRAVLQLGIGASCSALVGHPLIAQQKLERFNRFPRMVQEFYVAELRRRGRENRERKLALKTRADAVAYVEDIRRKIRGCFGPEPARTPLNPRVTGVVERDDYRIEKIIFESRPGFLVTANLYLPRKLDKPVPGIVGTCGHSSNGKASEAYQSFSQGLARLGMACLIYDPIGQGERLQYVNADLSPVHQPGVTEHLIAGNQQFLVGEFIGMWRAWDGMRALDYLLTRKEIDPRHLGVTGNSGGGTMTTWLAGVERRWTMAAPSCFVTTFQHNLENELPADTEQCPPGVLAAGLEHEDFLAAMAPKPVLIMAQEQDYFDARGAEEAFRRLKRLYALLGAKDQVGLFVGPNYHGYSQENREAMYRWFQRASGSDGADHEPQLNIEEDATLWCTPHGQVAEFKSRTVFSFTKEKAAQLAASRGAVSGSALRTAVADVLKISPREDRAPYFRILRYPQSRRYPLPYSIAYAVETEPRIQALVYRLSRERWYSRPPRAGGRAILYVAHLSSDDELRDEPLVKELIQAEPESAFFAVDVRGIGESMPDTCGTNSFHRPYGSDYFYAIHSLMLDQPYVGRKTWDVLRVLDWLASFDHDDVHLAGLGWGALSATFAALLADTVTQVTLKNAIKSYQEVAETEDYDQPLSVLLPGVLSRFDLPDCYRALAEKKIEVY